MIIISYDIQDDKLRTHFSKMLSKNGAIRLQYSVYEINNTKRVIDNIIVKIENIFSKEFSYADSIIIFMADKDKLIKYGNAIHRDTNVVYI
jgi:CRISPR-associated protein Cas2